MDKKLTKLFLVGASVLYFFNQQAIAMLDQPEESSRATVHVSAAQAASRDDAFSDNNFIQGKSREYEAAMVQEYWKILQEAILDLCRICRIETGYQALNQIRTLKNRERYEIGVARVFAGIAEERAEYEISQNRVPPSPEERREIFCKTFFYEGGASAWYTAQKVTLFFTKQDDECRRSRARTATPDPARRDIDRAMMRESEKIVRAATMDARLREAAHQRNTAG